MFKIRKSNKKAGFSLVEITISMSILLLIFALAYNFISTSFRATRFESEQAESIKNARKAINIITTEMRGANDSEAGDYAILSANTQDFIYYVDIDDDGETEKIKYFLDSNILKKVVTEPGPSDDYSSTGATTTIANYINNQISPVFIYYGSNNSTTTVKSNIKLVEIDLKVNMNPNSGPGDFHLNAYAHLRNLKNN